MATAGTGSVWNANNWHWEEKNFTKWTKELLQEKINALKAEDGDLKVNIASLERFTGDASASVRKGREIFSFDFSVTAVWEATKGDDRVKGELKVESIDQDDVEDDFDVAVTTHASGGLSTTARDLVKRQMVPQLREAFREMWKKMKERDSSAEKLSQDKARREEEKKKAEEARQARGEEQQKLYAAAQEAEAKRKAEEAAKASAADTAPKKIAPEGKGSVWNPNSYHWEEKPLTDRAKEEIKAVLAGADIDTPSGILKIVEVSGIAGDAAASIRKGRQLVFFEFTIETKWEFHVLNEDGTVKHEGAGSMKILEFDQDCEMEYETHADDESEDTREAMLILRKEALPIITDKLREVAEKLKNGFKSSGDNQ